MTVLAPIAASWARERARAAAEHWARDQCPALAGDVLARRHVLETRLLDAIKGWPAVEPWKDHGQSFSPPALPQKHSFFSATRDDTSQAEQRAYRRELYRLQDAGRRYAGELNMPRLRDCGRRRVRAETVSVRTCTSSAGDKPTAHPVGVLRCGNAWGCPVCSSQIRAARAEELTTAAQRWRDHTAGEVYLLSLTVAHEWGDELRPLRRGVARAWQRTIAGAPWLRIRGAFGIWGYVRALEVTVGPNGWHPHLHVLLFLDRKLEDDDDRERLRAEISARWAKKVSAVLGEKATPRLDKVGCDLRVSTTADYLSKMGLEVAAQLSKRGKGENRTPWELLAQTTTQDVGAYHAGWHWRHYVAGMHGARLLTWSRHLRELLALPPDVDDEDLAEPKTTRTIVVLPASTWDFIVRAGLVLQLLEASERGAFYARRFIREACGRRAAEESRALTSRALADEQRAVLWNHEGDVSTDGVFDRFAGAQVSEM